MIRRLSFLAFLTILLGGGWLWSESSKPPGGLRIHLQIAGDIQQTSQTASITLLDPEEVITVSTLPELTENQISEVKPLNHGDEMGMAIQFDRRGLAILNHLTIEGQGRVMVVYLNDRIIYSPVIDSVIDDGVLVIPSGVTPKDVEMMQALLKKLKAG
jgi:preprotein translocase subunit SecD